MASFEKTLDRNRTLYLFRLNKKFGNKSVFMDATEDFKEADKHDKKKGHREGGPMMGLAHSQAQAYADYVEAYATPETLNEFNTRKYLFFVKDGEKNTKPTKTKNQKEHVRTNVS